MNTGLNRKYTAISVALLIFLLITLFFVFKNTGKDAEQNSDDLITILWADWAPADYLKKLSEDFTEETGIKVVIEKESWGTWQKIFFDEMKVKGKKYDMVVGDSQWLGRGVIEGHYVSLSKWIRKNNVEMSMTENSMKGYSEFPRGSGQFWAIPLEGDAMAFSYRKDLFENPEEKNKFKKKYGYDLKVPENWIELRDAAEFFYRPDNGFYGILVWTEPDYDGITMGIDAFIWGWGAEIGNIKTHKVKGYLNSEEGINALEFYKELNSFNNPEWKYNYLDTHMSSNNPMINGEVAIAMCYLAIAPELLNPENSRFYDSIGFFPTPEGPSSRATSLGGQGISVISYSKKKHLSFKFLEWFIRDDVQEKWSELGGLSCNRNVLESDKFLSASPINKPYRDSIEIVRDFWAVPEYTELLAASQECWSQYIDTDEISAEKAMNMLAEKWEDIFDQAGYYKE